MLYRIITENINKAKIIELITKYFDGFTLIEGQGYWRGKSEKTLIIEIMTTGCISVKRLASRIKSLNNQESVLIQIIEAKDYLV